MMLEIERQRPPPFHHPQHQQLHRAPAACELHPGEVVTGFCASCLRERLASLEPSTAAHRKPNATGLKSLFFKASGQPSFLRPELRRCKSFSAGPRLSTSSLEPQRRSCDVRARSTLWSLFHQDDQKKNANANASVSDNHRPSFPSSSSNAAAAAALGGEIEIEVHNPFYGIPPPAVAAAPVLEAREEEEDNIEGDDEICAVDPEFVVETTGEISRVEEEDGAVEAKPMKDHIDLDAAQAKKPPPPRDLKEIAGSFWVAASVFSKKLQKWRRKQKLKKQTGKTTTPSVLQGEKPLSSRRFRDTQSEIAVDAFGRRSCDIDPRFSLDTGRISLDDPRYLWDEPRASWDGYLIGGRSVFARLPPMLSVVEDDPPVPVVQRSDAQIPVEEDAMIPGGSAQTRDYYLDSSSQRQRWSLDRSSSTRRLSVDMNELKLVSSAKVSPAATTEFFHAHDGGKLDKDSRDSSSTSLRDNSSESFGSMYRDPQVSSTRKPKRWGKTWNILGFIHWRSSGGGGRGGANVVDRPSVYWPELQRNAYDGKLLRSSSNASSRHSFGGSARFGSMRRNGMENNKHGKKRREEFVFERNWSARYSPSRADHGMLRFYLTPMRSSRRNGLPGKSSNRNSDSFTRSMLRMY